MNKTNLNRILIILLFIIISLNCYLIYLKYTSDKLLQKANTALLDKNKQFKFLENELDKLGKFIILGSVSEPFSVNDSIIRSTQTNYKNFLVFRFNEENCTSCINMQLKMINSLKINFDKKQVLIISGFNNKVQFDTFNKEFSENFNVINLRNGKLPLDGANEPYYFVLSSNGQTGNLFFPSSLDSSLTKTYLETISEQITN